MKSFELLQTVVATANFSDHSVLAGDLGSVVEIYEHPRLAYEVEFVNPDGTTRALLTLAPAQIRPLSERDGLTMREVPF